jgi:hypothetical protein
MRDYEGRNSFYPAAKKVFANPIVKWVGGAALAAITAAVTTGIWPFFKGWVITRASTEVVTQLDTRLGKLESARVVSIGNLNTDDTSALTEGERLQWVIIRLKRLEMRSVQEMRKRIGLEARLRMPRPNSKAAEGVAATVKSKFDDLVFRGEDPQVAAQKALESVYGQDE